MIKCLVLNGVKQVGFTEGGSFRILLGAAVVPFLPAALGLPFFALRGAPGDGP